MGRAPCCDKANVKKGPWSPEEDAKLKSYIEQNGTGGNWISLPQKIGLKRCGKSCRLRWLNYLRPNIKHGGFSEEEDNIICSLYLSIGSRWSIIAAQLPGRTDNDIKNYWNTRLKKKLLGKQRKEQGRGGSNNGLKQGTRKAIAHGKPMVDTNTINQAPYWPELPVLAPIPYSNHEPRFNDHASIRKLLIKLGGKFSDEENQIQDGSHLQLPVINSYELVPHPIEMISSSSATSNGALNACTSPFSGLPMMSGNSNFPSGFDEMGYHNSPQRIDGMEFLYEDMVSSGMRNSSSTGESIDWGEMSNLGYPPIFSNYEGDLQQGMVQECGFDDLRYSGVH